jgi:hypothetical protein
VGGEPEAAPPRYPRGPAVVPHRKNAAEWLMYATLYPFAWVVSRLRPAGRSNEREAE